MVDTVYNSQHALTQAISLANQGIPVFACRIDRTPIPYNGFNGATKDHTALTQQFSKPEAVCIGIPTGAVSGYAVLDVDFKNGALHWWEHHRYLAATSYCYQTPSGGFHIYFKCPPDLRCSNGSVAPGIDIKANGGYVVYHPANGFPILSNAPLDAFPTFLIPPLSLSALPRLQPKQVSDKYAMTALSNAIEKIESAQKGERNDTLSRSAYGLFSLRNSLLRHTDIKEQLLNAAKLCGLPESEAKRTIESASKKFNNENEIADYKQISGFSFTRADQLKQIKVEYLIEGILSIRSQSCWFGKTGSFKSFAALSAGLSVASGTPWYGITVKQGIVLYICGEGKMGLSKRLRAWESHGGVSLQNVPFYVSSSAADFSDQMNLQEIEAAISAIGQIPALIIIDTLSRNTSQDEDKSENMARLIKCSDMLKDKYGAAVLWVHHTGHSERERPRGSSVLTAAMDHEYRFDRDKDKLAFICTKNKEAVESVPLRFSLKSVPVNIEGFLEFGAVLVTDNTVPIVIDHVSPQQHHALDVLSKSVQVSGAERAIDGLGNIKCITLDQFKQKMMEARIVNSTNPASIKRVHDRILKDLSDAKHITIYQQNLVWPNKKAGHLQTASGQG